MPALVSGTTGTVRPLDSSAMGCTTTPTGIAQRARSAVLLGMAAHVRRMLSGEQLPRMRLGGAPSAAPRASPVGRGIDAGSTPSWPMPPPPSTSDSNCSASCCAP
eukprot:355827-Chlamydomonas_euryale.AAC.18